MDAPRSTSTQSSLSSTARTSPIQSKIVPPPRRDVNSSASTDAFLKDFTLVAEAAKRAQMAVLMRDFESVGLS